MLNFSAGCILTRFFFLIFGILFYRCRCHKQQNYDDSTGTKLFDISAAKKVHPNGLSSSLIITIAQTTNRSEVNERVSEPKTESKSEREKEGRTENITIEWRAEHTSRIGNEDMSSADITSLWRRCSRHLEFDAEEHMKPHQST